MSKQSPTERARAAWTKLEQEGDRYPDGTLTREAITAAMIEFASQAAQPAEADGVEPIPMLLFCPVCHLQHIDEPDEHNAGWDNPPHRSHLCHGCGNIWRPADVPTEGVRAIATIGKADTWLAATPKAPATDAGEVEILARQRSPIVADYDENYLVARVSRDGKQVGIDHPCDAVWSDVMLAHVALRDYINERIARQDACPFKTKALATPPAPNDDLREALERAGRNAEVKHGEVVLHASDWLAIQDALTQENRRG